MCGDGAIEGDEECDDDGTDEGDGCSDTCTVEEGFDCDSSSPSVCSAVCGDGIILGAEECDDDDADDDDGCSASCTLEDGFVCDDAEPTDCTETCSGLPVMARDPATDHCYVRIDSSLSWAAARAACQELPGGDLAALSTAEERTFINGAWDPNYSWLGGTDAAEEGVWTWSNGEAWTDSVTPGTPPWLTGEPNDAHGNEDCLYLTPERVWNDFRCTREIAGSICELPTSPILEETCGDGIDLFAFGMSEQCDDGNSIETDDCTSQCRSTLCDGGTCHAASTVLRGGTRLAHDSTACVPLIVTADDVLADPENIWVSMQLEHGDASGLVLQLRSPNDTARTLVNRRGAGAALSPNKTLIFRDDAATAATALDASNSSCGASASCSFSPEQSLSVLLSEEVVGTWQLCLTQSDNGNQAYLHSARLSLF